MPEVTEQAARDVAVYRAWVNGARRIDLADQYQVTKQAIDKAIRRVAADLPPVDKAAEVHRAIDLCEGMLSVWVPDALAKDKGASREARGWASLLLRAAGIDRRELHVSGQVEHEHVDRGPTVEELLERWRAAGTLKVRGELTRLDQEGT